MWNYKFWCNLRTIVVESLLLLQIHDTLTYLIAAFGPIGIVLSLLLFLAAFLLFYGLYRRQILWLYAWFAIFFCNFISHVGVWTLTIRNLVYYLDGVSHCAHTITHSLKTNNATNVFSCQHFQTPSIDRFYLERLFNGLQLKSAGNPQPPLNDNDQSRQTFRLLLAEIILGTMCLLFSVSHKKSCHVKCEAISTEDPLL